jgi:hypothetical protein
MKVAELHEVFLKELGPLLPGWKFVASQRHFKRAAGPVNWFFHISFANHASDFDAVGDVAVEFVAAKKRVAIFGAQLGNIASIGQTRHGVCSPATAAESAKSLASELQLVGVPFLQRYSNPAVVLSALQAGEAEACLISPIQQLHAEQALALRQLRASPNSPFKADGFAAA